MDLLSNVQFVVLAARKGARMGDAHIPKVLHRLHDRPLIQYLAETLSTIPSRHMPIIVVGYKAEMVQQALGPLYKYVLQTEQLGTGHAVMVAKGLVAAPHVMVLYGDTPFVKPRTLRRLLAGHIKSGAVMTMATTTVPDFQGWRDNFMAYGRVIRSAQEEVQAIREYADASSVEKAILEINAGLYVFKTGWLFEHLGQIGNVNARGEYYLTDLVALAMEKGHVVPTVSIRPAEAMGINTQDHLRLASAIVPRRYELILE
jgi:bifunctional UDP-N-acetylglucosamine pyrophosphorylase/glucosamine-1-phosphate N-acetyltransferase